jgi:hypothetical protein
MKPSAFDALAQSRIVRDYEAAFRGATGMSIKLVPADGGRKRHLLAQPENSLCALITKSAAGKMCEAALFTKAYSPDGSTRARRGPPEAAINTLRQGDAP